jgi:hypothetical protein
VGYQILSSRKVSFRAQQLSVLVQCPCLVILSLHFTAYHVLCILVKQSMSNGAAVNLSHSHHIIYAPDPTNIVGISFFVCSWFLLVRFRFRGIQATISQWLIGWGQFHTFDFCVNEFSLLFLDWLATWPAPGLWAGYFCFNVPVGN